MAYLFDNASSQYMEWTDSASPTFGPSQSFACWFKTDDLSSSQVLLQYVDKNVPDVYLMLFIRDVAGNMPVTGYHRATGAGTVVNTTSYVSINTWHHACFVWTLGNIYAYIDGGSKGTQAGTFGSVALNRFAIGGARDSSPDGYMSGYIAEAAHWYTNLSDDDVALLAKGYSPKLVKRAFLSSYWPLVRGANDRLAEDRGSRNMTVSGATVAEHPRIIYGNTINIGEHTYVAPAATGQPTTLRSWVKHVGAPYQRRGL